MLAVLLTWVLCKPGVLASTAKKPVPKQILVIFAFKQALPWAYRVEESMRATFASESPFPIELNVEHADRPRHPDDTYLRKAIDFYRYKYANQKIDLVFEMGGDSRDLLFANEEKLFGNIPVVLITNDGQHLPSEIMKPNMTPLSWGFDIKRTIKIIQDVRPQTKNLFMISGISQIDQSLNSLALEALKEYGAKLNVENLNGLAVVNLLEKAANLPEDSAILYLSLFRDASGQYFVPREILRTISEKANAPTFGIGDTYLGHGIVGGCLLSAGKQGKKFADIAINLLKGEPINAAESIEKDNLLMFDWRQLKRWGIPEQRLPKGSIVTHREKSFFGQHKWIVIGIILFVALQSGLIGLLIRQNRKQRVLSANLMAAESRYRHLLRVERVSRLGELSASLAHELNQPLAAIRSSSQAALRFLQSDALNSERLREILQNVVEDSKRAAEVVRGMRAILKRDPEEKAPVAVNDVLNDVLTIFQGEAAARGVRIETHSSPTLPLVMADKSQLQQVMLNLIMNAADAVSQNTPENRKIFISTREKGGKVQVVVRDTGIGIDPTRIDKVFEPLFTTKTGGMGMGLALCWNIIREHDGRIRIENNSGGGVSVTFEMPAGQDD